MDALWMYTSGFQMFYTAGKHEIPIPDLCTEENSRLLPPQYPLPSPSTGIELAPFDRDEVYKCRPEIQLKSPLLVYFDIQYVV